MNLANKINHSIALYRQWIEENLMENLELQEEIDNLNRDLDKPEMKKEDVKKKAGKK